MSVVKVKIRHEETGQESKVVASSVGVWQANGWTVVEDEGSQQEPVADPPAPDVQVTKVKNGGPVAPDTSKKE